ncbi:MAG TPA: TonB family protein [Acidobacteriaceae bacterium]|nr:TonB family protein [Acidobacteriaceae bacterium]
MDILSDTQGVDFKPYVRSILTMIYDHWIPLLPEDARPPRRLAGTTLVRFTISKDGGIQSMHLDGSTHQDSLNRAAWGAITGVHTFPPLPDEFHGPSLELRIRFQVNQENTGTPTQD